LGIENIKTHY